MELTLKMLLFLFSNYSDFYSLNVHKLRKKNSFFVLQTCKQFVCLFLVLLSIFTCFMYVFWYTLMPSFHKCKRFPHSNDVIERELNETKKNNKSFQSRCIAMKWLTWKPKSKFGKAKTDFDWKQKKIACAWKIALIYIIWFYII